MSWIWIGLMLAVVSRLFFYKKIARHLLRKFADNSHEYKANFLWWFAANLRVFIVREANYSYQFCYLIKKCPDDIQNEERVSWSQKDAWRKNRQFMLHIFINILQFLIFVDKSWFKVRNLFIYLSIHVYFKVRLPANECYESSS